MRLKEIIKFADNAHLVHIKRGETTIWQGYKGCMEYHQEALDELESEVEDFRVLTRVNRRGDEGAVLPVTELNCGLYNYVDLTVRLVYTYSIKEKNPQ